MNIFELLISKLSMPQLIFVLIATFVLIFQISIFTMSFWGENIKHFFCKNYKWKIDGWEHVKCSKCGFSKYDKGEASKIINNSVNNLPEKANPDAVIEKLNSFN